MKFHRYLTIGRYLPGDSPVHRADPRVKLLLGALFAAAAFLAGEWGALAALALLGALALLVSRVPPSVVLGNLRGLWVIFLVTLLMAATDKGETVLWRWELGQVAITREGLVHGLRLCAQMALAVTGFALMTATTTVFHLSAGLERLLRPLAAVRFPVEDFAMMLALAVRFFPVLTEETETVIRAQVARGAPLESGGPARKLRAMAAVLVPVFVRTFRHAGEMALAMECRLYGHGPRRTQLNPLLWRGRDTALLLAGAGSILLVFGSRWFR